MIRQERSTGSRSQLTAVTRAADKAASALRARDDAIRNARTEGHTLRAIAAAAGLSFARIDQITKNR
jgi:hypothetical protein